MHSIETDLSENYCMMSNRCDQGSANSGSRHLRLWVAKNLNVGLHNYVDVMTFFCSVFFLGYFFELFGFGNF